MASISDTEAVVSTASGVLCLLNDGEGSQRLSLAKHVDFGIASLAVDLHREAVWVGGGGGQVEYFTFQDLRTSVVSAAPSSGAVGKPMSSRRTKKESSVTSMGLLPSHLITVDAKRAIRLYPIDNLYDVSQQNRTGTLLPAHGDAVLGIRPLRTPNSLDAEFFTWSSGGAINFWDAQGKHHGSRKAKLDQLSSGEDDVWNELRIVCAAEDMSFFVSGDKLGVLRCAPPFLL